MEEAFVYIIGEETIIAELVPTPPKVLRSHEREKVVETYQNKRFSETSRCGIKARPHSLGGDRALSVSLHRAAARSSAFGTGGKAERWGGWLYARVAGSDQSEQTTPFIKEGGSWSSEPLSNVQWQVHDAARYCSL